jgi:hypothetical protein
MERILIKRTKINSDETSDLSFYRIELPYYYECFRKFFDDKEKLKYNQHEKIEIVDKKVNEMYEMWENINANKR